MSREYSALQSLRAYLVAHMDTTPQASLTDTQVVVDYPDVDKMPHNVMVYIVPDSAAFQPLTTQSSLANMSAIIYILQRQSQTINTMPALIESVFDYFGSLLSAVRLDATIGGAVDEMVVESFDFYPVVSGISTAAGIEVKCTMTYER